MNSPYGLPCVEDCLTCHLRPKNFFCALSKESVEAFNHIKHSFVYPEHAAIFLEGQSVRGVFMLCEGQSKLSTTARDGKTFILRIAKAGEVLGLQAALTGQPHELTAETMQPCHLNFVSREDFLSFLKKHGDACLQAAQHIGREYQDACDVIHSVGLSHSISERLAKLLLELSAEGRVANGVVKTKLALTHEEISQCVGSSRETITRALGELRRMKIVELTGSTLTVRNKTALARLGAA